MPVPEISVQEFEVLKKSGKDFFLLDVRNPDEYEECNLGGYLIPFNQLSQRLNELDPSQNIIVHCHAGGRASKATEFLIQNGYKQVRNLKGGLTAWINEIDPDLKK